MNIHVCTHPCNSMAYSLISCQHDSRTCVDIVLDLLRHKFVLTWIHVVKVPFWWSIPFLVSLFCGLAAKLLQSRPTLWEPIDGSPPGSAIPGILQARTLEWVAISFSSAWKEKVKVKSLSLVRLLVTPWTAAYQAPPSMGFSRQEYWSGVPLPSPSLTTKRNNNMIILFHRGQKRK